VGRTGNRTDDACPRGVFPCAGEDDWCALEVKDDEDWQRLVEALGSPAWTARAELGTHAGRKQQEDELERALAGETRNWDKWELMARLQERGVRAGAVETSRDLLEVDPHLRARGVWHAPPHEVLGPMPVNCAPYRVNGHAVPPRSAAPLLGEHTRALARDLLGVDDDEFARLEADELFV
jgi:benzylsuccinate CoA-transferase BbsF subunit